MMDNRLGRIEQMLADVREQGRRRQIREERSQQSLANLRQETRNTHLAVVGLRKLLAKQHATLVARLRETAAQPSADFWAVDVPMGALPNGGQNAEVRRIPTQIPDKAREILVYAQVATGYVKGGPHRFRISVRVQGDREAAFYLYAVGLPQQSWAYNSDNVWLPMPRDRQLILRAEGEKQSAILEAEGRREAAFRDAEAREREAEAEARATAVVSEAIGRGDVNAINYFIAQDYVKAFEKLALSPQQKTVIIPAELTALVGTLGGVGILAKEALSRQEGNPAVRSAGSVPESR